MSTNYQAGGKVAVTTRSGAKVSGVLEAFSVYTNATVLRIALGNGGYLAVIGFDGSLARAIVSVDEYTPPTPEWVSRTDVTLLMLKNNPGVKAVCNTIYGKIQSDSWFLLDGTQGRWMTNKDLIARGEWEILGVKP